MRGVENLKKMKIRKKAVLMKRKRKKRISLSMIILKWEILARILSDSNCVIVK